MLKSLHGMCKNLALIPFPENITYKFCIASLSYIGPKVKFKQMLYILFVNLFLLLHEHSSMFSLNVRL